MRAITGLKMWWLSLSAIAIFLAGCGESRAQLDELSQCREDITSAVIAHSSGAKSDHVGILMAAAMDRLDAYVLGTDTRLPPPKVRASDLAASPEIAAKERDASYQSRMHPPVSPSFPWFAAILGAVGIAIPGIGTAMGCVSKLRSKLATMTGSLHSVIDAIENTPDEQSKPIKRAIAATHNTTINAEVAKRTKRSKKEVKHG